MAHDTDSLQILAKKIITTVHYPVIKNNLESLEDNRCQKKGLKPITELLIFFSLYIQPIANIISNYFPKHRNLLCEYAEGYYNWLEDLANKKLAKDQNHLETNQENNRITILLQKAKQILNQQCNPDY